MTLADQHDAATAGDRRFMAAALALGRRGLGCTSPNPSVGAIVVKDGIVVGRGWTGEGGRPHGERIALEQAGAAAEGATLYVTLEPCSHHGETPPCCEAVVAAGISRLVYAIEDINPLVAGAGIAFCRARGIEAIGGVEADAARRDHRGHIIRFTEKRPLVTLKLAETADGFAAGGLHDRRLAITGVAANGLVHVMRAMHDAVMVGIGTVRSDDPLMTVRLPGVSAKPLRIVLDAKLVLSAHSRLVQTASVAPVLVLAGEKAITANGKHLADVAGVEILPVSLAGDGRIDLAAALTQLADRGLTRIFSEGGPAMATSLIRDRLADDVLLFTASKPFGGEGVASLDAGSRDALDSAYSLRHDRSIGADRLRLWELAR